MPYALPVAGGVIASPLGVNRIVITNSFEPMEAISFKDDLLKYVGTFLLGLAPVLLLNNFVIDRLSIIFNIDAFSAFRIYTFLYFSLPFIVILLFHLIIDYRRPLRYINLPLLVITMVFLAISLFGSSMGVEVYNIILFSIFIAAFLYLVATNVRQFIDKQWTVDLSLYKLLFEFGLLVIVILVVSSLYISNNRTTFEHFGDKDLSYTIQSSDSVLIKSGLNGGSQLTVFEVKDHYTKLSSQSESEIKWSRSFVNAWSKVINHTNYRGVSLLMIALATWILFWISYGLHNLYDKKNHDNTISSEITLKKVGDSFAVQKPREFPTMPRVVFLKNIVTFFAILITPLFYTSNSLKDPAGNPHINLGGKTTVTTENITYYDTTKINVYVIDTLHSNEVKVIDEENFIKLMASHDHSKKVEKYLKAIWDDQRKYSRRLKGGKGLETVLWNNVDTTGLGIHPLKRGN